MIRLVTLNLNHRTHPKRIPESLVPALGELEPEILVLTEFVAGEDLEQFQNGLSDIGLGHWALSEKFEYTKGRYHNQVMIASRDEIKAFPAPEGGPDGCARTNYLAVETQGLLVTGVRAPTYEGRVWQEYWDWLANQLVGDIAIGDFNVDPARGNKRDRVLDGLLGAGGWALADVEGDWSYCGHTGNKSMLDHAVVRGGVAVSSAKYVPEQFVPDITDHAALVVEVLPSVDY